MSDVLFKLSMLPNFLLSGLREWKSELWDRDLDEYLCCPGNPGPPDFCGCQGVTIRSIYTHTKDQPHD